MSWAHPGSHTSAGESGAGFGRLGQAVSGNRRGVVAGSRSPHRYRVIVRRCDEKTTQNHRCRVAGRYCKRGSVTAPTQRVRARRTAVRRVPAVCCSARRAHASPHAAPRRLGISFKAYQRLSPAAAPRGTITCELLTDQMFRFRTAWQIYDTCTTMTMPGGENILMLSDQCLRAPG
jgi:hypothetical protein